jgi:UDP-GlcNAc:undecaprenyl-phosphate GlcNAc-1-phosphate transferase
MAILPPSGLLVPLLVSLAVTLIATPLVRGLAIRLAIYDRPDAGLKPHERPVPFLGGLAIYCGWLAALAIASRQTDIDRPLLWIAVSGTLLLVTGLIDDFRHLPPKLRLAIQALAAAGLIYGGVGRRAAAPIVGLFDGIGPAWATGEAVCLVASGLLAAFVLAGAMNAANLIDGMDGLCAGVMAICMAAIACVGCRVPDELIEASPAGGVVFWIAAAVIGACLGFLFFNYHRASIFMGDSGSLLLGFSVGVALLALGDVPNGAGELTWRWMVGAGIAFAFPILDTAVAMTRRRLHRRPLFVGDRSHIYDQLNDRGWGVRRTVLICYVIAAAFGVIAVIAVRLPLLLFMAVIVGLPGIAAIVVRRFGLLKVDDAAQLSGSTSADDPANRS